MGRLPVRSKGASSAAAPRGERRGRSRRRRRRKGREEEGERDARKNIFIFSFFTCFQSGTRMYGARDQARPAGMLRIPGVRKHLIVTSAQQEDSQPSKSEQENAIAKQRDHRQACAGRQSPYQMKPT